MSTEEIQMVVDGCIVAVVFLGLASFVGYILCLLYKD